MEFYTCSEIKTDLPTTRYRGEITEVKHLENGAISFIEKLPLGNNQQRLIPPDSIFLGTIEDAAKFYPSEVVAVGNISAIKANTESVELLNLEVAPVRYEPINQGANASLSILERFA